MKWLVLWLMVTQVQVPTGDNADNPYINDYPNQGINVVNRKKAEWHFRIFDHKFEAEKYIENAPKNMTKKMHLVDISEDEVPAGMYVPFNDDVMKEDK